MSDRYYGLVIGDVVTYNNPNLPNDGKQYTVVGYGFLNNNQVVLKDKDGNTRTVIAEYCNKL